MGFFPVYLCGHMAILLIQEFQSLDLGLTPIQSELILTELVISAKTYFQIRLLSEVPRRYQFKGTFFNPFQYS